MKSKHYIETVEDIKYCEKNGLTIYSDTWEPNFFRFVNGVWCMYSDKELKSYGNCFDISYDELYYKDELKEEPMQEATVDDVNKLCWFWGSNNENKELGVLESVNCVEDEIEYESCDGFCYSHCCRLTPSEVAEITGYKVEEAE